jgi:anti-sigma factor RsiW
MSDCLNVEMRELLPEYLSETLSAFRRSEVEGHLAACSDCAQELVLLQHVRQAYAEMTPSVNVSAIVSALPRRTARPVVRYWGRSHAFQIAAAVSFIALGGISLAVARSFFGLGQSAVTVDSVVVSGANVDSPAIRFAGGVSDLRDEDLESLLSTLESIEALPVTEPAEMPLSTGRQGS